MSSVEGPWVFHPPRLPSTSRSILEEFWSTRHLARVDSQGVIIFSNSTLQRQRLSPIIRSRKRPTTAVWRNSCGKSLPLHLHHQSRPTLRASGSPPPRIFKLSASLGRPPTLAIFLAYVNQICPQGQDHRVNYLARGTPCEGATNSLFLLFHRSSSSTRQFRG